MLNKHGVLERILHIVKAKRYAKVMFQENINEINPNFKKGYKRFELSDKELGNSRNVELPFEIFIPEDNEPKKALYIPGWCKFLLVNSKGLYHFSKIGFNKINNLFESEILDDPNVLDVDKKLIDALIKEVEKLDK